MLLFQNVIPLYVNRLNTEESVIPFEYHHFDFCTTDESQSPVENLGQVVFGERIRPSPYKINFLENVECRKLCTKEYNSDAESNKKLNLLKMGLALYYQHHWILDNMPVTWCYLVNEGGKMYCSTGFPMGCQVRRDMVSYFFRCFGYFHLAVWVLVSSIHSYQLNLLKIYFNAVFIRFKFQSCWSRKNFFLVEMRRWRLMKQLKVFNMLPVLEHYINTF